MLLYNLTKREEKKKKKEKGPWRNTQFYSETTCKPRLFLTQLFYFIEFQSVECNINARINAILPSL